MPRIPDRAQLNTVRGVTPPVPAIENGLVTYRLSLDNEAFAGSIEKVIERLSQFKAEGWQSITEFTEDWLERIKAAQEEYELKQLKQLQKKYRAQKGGKSSAKA